MSWYYARGGQQRGPVDFQKLVAAAKAGKLRQDDMVWTEGMAEWKPAGDVPEFGLGGPTAVAIESAAVAHDAPIPVAAEPNEVSYYTSRATMPERATQALRGWAPPLGDVGLWPLDDGEMAQWVEACKHRKQIRSAHGLFRGLCALYVIGTVIFFFVTAAAILNSRRGAGTESIVLGVVFLVFAGLAVVSGLAAGATRKNHHAWGAITMSALIGLGLAANLVSGLIAMAGNARDPAAGFITMFISLTIGGLMLYVSARAIPAMKRFRAVPAWCQELTAVAKF